MRILLTFALLIAQVVYATDFSEMHAGMSFTDVQKAYPTARFEITSPQPIDKTYQTYELKRSKHPGRIVLTFLNGYAVDHFAISEFEQKLMLATRESEKAKYRENIQNFKKSVERPLKDQLLLHSFIWQPIEPLPINQVIKTYGPPEGDGFDKALNAAYIRWKDGVFGYPAPSGKGISFFEYRYATSKPELVQSYLK